MKNDVVDLPSEYEEMLAKLESQITNLFSEITYYQALITEKDNIITRLTAENFQLKTQLKNAPQTASSSPSPPPRLNPPPQSNQGSLTSLPTHPQQDYPSSYPSQDSYTPPPTPQHMVQTSPSSEDGRINKRLCPECGAMGFAIKEVDDKTRIISYTPRRIYAKKKVCTKCRCEFV
ncbi:MAG: hypothetical protein ACFFA0_10745 [Promethearchaeota archaeon]